MDERLAEQLGTLQVKMEGPEKQNAEIGKGVTLLSHFYKGCSVGCATENIVGGGGSKEHQRREEKKAQFWWLSQSGSYMWEEMGKETALEGGCVREKQKRVRKIWWNSLQEKGLILNQSNHITRVGEAVAWDYEITTMSFLSSDAANAC